MRKIKNIVVSEKVNMDGFIVEQPLPTSQLDQHDPFLLIHHANHKHHGNKKSKDVGVGPHPHRGFSPVTFIFQGEVHHRDSRGNNQVVGEGGMQWMSAGMGIIHSERPSEKLADKGGRMEIIQVWVNTPSAHKLDQPYYLPIHRADLTEMSRDEGKVQLFLYSGNLEGFQGPAEVPYPVTMLRMDLKSGGSYSYDSNSNENVLIYQLNGLMKINDSETSGKDMIVFHQEEGKIHLEAKEDSQLILLSGKPIHEPVAKYGPFVMNTQTEVLEAMRDYQMGKMGVLIEEF